MNKRSFLICASHRSGSSYLFDSLLRTGIAGRLANGPVEDFLKQPLESAFATGIDIEGYIRLIQQRRTSENGVFGAKLMWNDFARLCKLIKEKTKAPKEKDDRELLEEFFPNLIFVQITRRDKLKQAISFVKMQQARISHLVRNPKELGGNIITESQLKLKKPELVYDYEAIEGAMKILVREEEKWNEYLLNTGIERVSVVYEHLVENYQDVMQRLLAYIVPHQAPAIDLERSNFVKIADEENDAWAERFLRGSKSP